MLWLCGWLSGNQDVTTPARRNGQAWIFFSPPGNSWHLDRVVLLTKFVKPTKAPQHFHPARILALCISVFRRPMRRVSINDGSLHQYQFAKSMVLMFHDSFNLSLFFQTKKTQMKGIVLWMTTCNIFMASMPVSVTPNHVHVWRSWQLSLVFFSRFPSVPSFLAGHVDPWWWLSKCSGRYVGYSWIDL